MTILVADDETDILNLIKLYLTEEGYEVVTASNGMTAYHLFEEGKIDMAILDIMMPGMDGLTFLRKIREKSEMPVIFITARGEEIDRVAGLSQGADDYLVKPFSLAELSARVAVQIKHLKRERQTTKSATIYKLGDVSIDLEAGTVKKDEQDIALNAKEFMLLRYMVENRDRVLTKKQIYEAVWGEEYMYDDNTIMVHFSKLRSKLENNPKEPEYLITLKGIGYKLQFSK